MIQTCVSLRGVLSLETLSQRTWLLLLWAECPRHGARAGLGGWGRCPWLSFVFHAALQSNSGREQF